MFLYHLVLEMWISTKFQLCYLHSEFASFYKIVKTRNQIFSGFLLYLKKYIKYRGTQYRILKLLNNGFDNFHCKFLPVHCWLEKIKNSKIRAGLNGTDF